MVNIHLRRCASFTPRKPSSREGEAISRSDHSRQTPGHLSCLDLGRSQNAGPTKSAPLRTTWVPEPEWLRPGKCIQPMAGLRQFPAEQPRAWAVLTGKVHTPWAGANPVWQWHCEHTPVLFACSVPPSSQHDWTSERKKVSTNAPLCQGAN